jgi:hypothetical protein
VIRVRFPESWSSTSLAKKAVPRHCTGYFRLDRAFSLIEGHPRFVMGKKSGAWQRVDQPPLTEDIYTDEIDPRRALPELFIVSVHIISFVDT